MFQNQKEIIVDYMCFGYSMPQFILLCGEFEIASYLMYILIGSYLF